MSLYAHSSALPLYWLSTWLTVRCKPPARLTAIMLSRERKQEPLLANRQYTAWSVSCQYRTHLLALHARTYAKRAASSEALKP